MKLSCFTLLFFLQLYHARQVSTSRNGLRIPLTRTPLMLEKLGSTSMEMKSFYYKGKMIKVPVIPLLNYKNVEYSGPVSIGTPSRKFQMIFDTGSSQLWVFSERCKTSSCKGNNRNTYHYENSTTYKSPKMPKCDTFIQYGRGQVSGFCSTDTISMDGITLKNREFLEVANTENLPDGPYEGIVGLRYNTNKQSDDIITKLCKSVKQENKFSFYFSSDISDTDGGELTLCGVNESKFHGPINFVNTTEPLGEWYIRIQNVTLQKGEEKTIIESSNRAIVDTGTTAIAVPTGSILKIYDSIKNTSKAFGEIDCGSIHKLPNLTIAIGKEKYILGGEDYILKVETNSKTRCGLGIIPSPVNEWILGDIFLKKYYSVFDIENQRIGFAESVHRRKPN